MEPENQEKEIEMEQEPIKVYKGGAVNSVNGKTGDVVLTTSDLENDSDYQTGTEVAGAIDSAIGELNIPTKTSDLENDGEDGSSVYIEADELASVATSGSYNDLENKPTIPAAQVNSDWNADSGVAQILNKPTIPTVNDATLTITQNGTSKGTFTANDSDDTTIEVSDTTYTAGTGIDITNGVISATGGGGPSVVQTTGTSTTDVMSQKASSEILYGAGASTGRIALLNYNPDERISPSSGQYNRLGSHSVLLSTDWINAAGEKNVMIGGSAGGGLGPSSPNTNLRGSVVIGYNASNDYNGSVSLGSYTHTSSVGEVNIGSSNTSYGYNSTNYRLLTGVHDPVDAHDAATKGYVDAHSGGGGGDTVYSDKTTSNRADGGAVYIGNLDANQDEQPDPTTTDNHYSYFWALPFDNAQIPQQRSINIFGQNEGMNSISLGTNAIARLDSQVAIGAQTLNNYSATEGVALGYSARSQAASSVALGARATATRAGEVNVGNRSGEGFNNTEYRVIGGVHDGQNAHDCATVGQINATIDAINTALSTNIPHIGA